MEYVIAFVALTAMEIVLGIDNIVFIAILTGRLPADQQRGARRAGLGLALVMRIMLLASLSYIMTLTYPIFHLSAIIPEQWLTAEINAISVKDLILIVGGLFLIWKSVHEIHNKVQGEHEADGAKNDVSFRGVLIQIALMDAIFSLDSVITAVGMVEGSRTGLLVMIAAVIVAMVVMLIFAEPVSRFVARHPTLKILALSFLILIGVMLVAEGIGTHFNKGYIYFAMAFSLVVEMINLRLGRKASLRPGPVV